MNITVLAFYKFIKIPNYKDYQSYIAKYARDLNILGTIILADEGINGTISSSHNSSMEFINYIKKLDPFNDLEYKIAHTQKRTFNRFKLKIKKQIVTYCCKIKAYEKTGYFVEPKDWNKLIEDPDVVTIDTRNNFEYQVGTFKNAINPNTKTFSQFWEYLKHNIDPKKKIAMFCTGGIRCEAASSHMLYSGFDKVYQLKGGILNYLQKVPPEKSLWQGECFVFDHRVTTTYGQKDGSYILCYGCRMPLSPKDLKHILYEKGVSCHHCALETTGRKKDDFRQRQKYFDRL